MPYAYASLHKLDLCNYLQQHLSRQPTLLRWNSFHIEVHELMNVWFDSFRRPCRGQQLLPLSALSLEHCILADTQRAIQLEHDCILEEDQVEEPSKRLMVAALRMNGWLLLVTTFAVSSSCCRAFLPYATQEADRVRKTKTPLQPADSPDDDSVVRLVPIANASHELRSMLLRNETEEFIRVEGVVTAKRAFGKSFGFFDLVEDTTTGHDPLQAMYKRQEYGNATRFPIAERLLQPGTRLAVVGRAAPTRNPGQAVLRVHQLSLLRLPANPQHVRILLQLLRTQRISAEDVADPCLDMSDFVAAADNLSRSVLEHRLRRNPDAEQLYELAKEIVANQTTTKNCSNLLVGTYAQTAPGRFVLPTADPELRVPPPATSQRTTTVQGVVLNRRRFDGNITVIAVETDDGQQRRRQRCVLHPNVFHNGASEYYHIVAPGSTVRVTGFLGVPSNNHRTTTGLVWSTTLELVRSSWRPSAIRHVVDLLSKGTLSCKEAARSLNMTVADCTALQSNNDVTERQWKVSEVSTRLQTEDSRVGQSLSPERIQSTLSKYTPLLSTYPAKPVELKMDTESSHGEPGSRWARKKEPQLHWMVERVQELVREHPAYGTRKLRIADIGGGQGYLANRMAQQLGDDATNITVIDVAARAVQNGGARSRKQQLSVNYVVGDASTVRVEADIVVALHACGALTDVSLGHAVANNASFVICPCCFRSNGHLKIPFLSRESSRERPFRSPESFLNVEKEGYADLRLLAEVQGDASLASSAMHSICALRASAVEHWAALPYNVSIKTFPIALSTRNYCLIGRPSGREVYK